MSNPDTPLLDQFDDLITKLECALESKLTAKFEEMPEETALISMGLIAVFAKFVLGEENPEVKAMYLLLDSDEFREEIKNNKEYVLEQLT